MEELVGKYRKKPIVIEAEQYQHPAKNIGGVVPGFVSGCNKECPDTAHVHTLEGPLHISVGDWIITGVKGEKYPCKSDVFKQTYDEVNDE